MINFLSFNKLIFSGIIFILAVCVHLYFEKKNVDHKYKIITSLFYGLMYGAMSVISIYKGYVIYDDRMYCIVFVIVFIGGMLLDKKSNMIMMIITIIAVILQPDEYDLWFTMKTDVVGLIAINIIGYAIGHILYKNTWPSPFTGFIYAVIMTSVYMIFYLFILIINKTEDIFNVFNVEYIIKIFIYGIYLFIILLVINIFFGRKEAITEKNNLTNIFLKKFRIVIVILYCATFAFMFVFNSIYEDRLNRSMMKVVLNNAEYDVKEDDEIYDDEYIQKFCKNWIWDNRGIVYILDKNFYICNKIEESYAEKVNMPVFKNDEFLYLKNRKEKEIYLTKNDDINYYVSYFKNDKYCFVLVVAKANIDRGAIVSSLLSSYAIVIVLFTIFILVLYIIKSSIIDKLQATNEKLNRITNGDYNVYFMEMSSKEFKELSYNINRTVSTLKNNIQEIEHRNIQEMQLAKKIQESQLRTDNIDHVAFEIRAKNIPAEDVGGDFYDYFYIDYRRIVFLVADVSGKGIPGAMFMIQAKNAIASFAAQSHNLEEMVKSVNDFLSQNNAALMFVTCFVATMDLKTGVVKFINAGHNHPIIGKKTENGMEYKYLDCKNQRFFGMERDVDYTADTIEMEEGDRLILYTDGVTEARDKERKFYGDAKLLETVKDINTNEPSKINKEIIDSVKEFSKDTMQYDDITLLTLVYKGRHNEILLNASEKDFDKGKDFLNKFIRLYEMSPDTERNIKIVYDEIYSNIKNHAYNNKGGELIFKVNLIERDIMEMIFMDKGPEFDPINCKSKKFEVKAEDKVDGGMGIMFCKNIMDDMKYERKDGYNILKMYKKF